jgi:peptidoglycan/xylan/chitin deacetylase (PgdA/CDA1 family)
VLRAHAEGHHVGNHSDSHARDPQPAGVLAREIRAVDAALVALYARAGVPAPRVIPFRLPYGPLVRDGGVLDERLEAIAAVGRTHAHWTAIFGDWDPDTRADALATALVDHVRAITAQGLAAVPVLHDAGTRRRANGFDRGATVDAVDRACAVLRPEGARFVRIDELA